MTDRIGQKLGNYYLVRLLGEGGFAEVYLGEHIHLGTKAAIKVLHTQLTADDIVTFRNEARTIAQLEHPHILRVVEYGVEGKTPFLVMSYIEGTTLADCIANTSAQGRIPSPVEIFNLFMSISLAVDYAHQKGMVHRDIKPANILLDMNNTTRNPMGEPILTDFGLAKLLGVSAGVLTAKQLGTQLYTSPEQAQGRVADKRSDLYSLGIILYEIMTGITPFRGENPLSIIMQHLYEAPPQSDLINPNVSSELSAVILRSIAKDPDARFQSASAMTTALAHAFNVPTSIELRPPEVFFSYAHQDKGLRDRLENHLSNLKYRGLITTWHDREIQAGEEWARQINIYLDKAHIILLLISSDFMASQYCYGIEMKRALERHERREADVIPILLRPVLYTDAPFAKLQMLPTNGKPVVNWRNRDSAFVDIALGLERVVQKRLERPTLTPPSVSFTPYPPAHVGSDYPQFSISQQSKPLSLPRTAPSRFRREGLILVGLPLIFLGLLSAGVLLLVQHPSFIPFIGITVGSLILLGGILLTIRALVKRAQSRAARRQEQQRQEVRRREQEEARRRELEEARRPERERVYYEKALAAYELALHRNNADATAHQGKGNALVGLDRYDEALTAFEQALVLTPLSTTYVSVGNVLATLGRCNEAVAAYELALALDASYASAYAGMSDALLQLGRTREAGYMRERAKQLGYEE